MGLDHVRSEIEHMRVQVGRQRKEILQLQRAGISTASAELLLTRMLAKIDDLCAERDSLKAEQGGQPSVPVRASTIAACTAFCIAMITHFHKVGQVCAL
jgi:hypothetical protein